MPATLAKRFSALPAAPLPPEHLGLSWRAARETDLWQIRELIHLTEAEAKPARPSSEGEINRLTYTLEGSPDHDCLVGLDSEARLQAFASVTVYPEDKEIGRADLFAVTHARWRGRGIGRALLAWQDVRARQLLLDTFGEESTIPLRIRNVVDEQASDRRMLYAAAGFSCFRSIKVFEHYLDPQDIAPASTDYPLLVNARFLQTSEWEKVRTLHIENSLHDGNSEEDALRWWKRAQNRLEADLSWVAFDSEREEVLAYALTVLRSVMKTRENVSTPPAGATRQSLVVTPQVSIEVLGENKPLNKISHADSNALYQVLNAVLRESRSAGYSTVISEDNNPKDGSLSAVFHRARFQTIGARMIYTVDL